MRLRIARQVGASREVLPQQQIGVLVRATLPGTLWIAEVDLHIGGHVNSLCLAISSPRSQVSERRKVAGSLPTCLLNAATTTAVSLPDSLISMRKRECRSTSVAM